MKACFIEKPKEDLTKDDLKSMIRLENPNHCIPVKEMIKFYDIKSVSDYINFLVSKGLRKTFRETFALREEKENGKTVTHNLNKSNPKPLASNLKPMDLTAMRYYRKVSKDELAKRIGLPRDFIDFMERDEPVSLNTEKYYIEALNLSKSHVNQIKKLLNGEITEVQENRNIPLPVQREVIIRDNGECVECGSAHKLHFHHKERFSDGGQNTIENLTLLCVSCHAEEHKDEKSYHMLKAMAEG